MTDFCVRLTFSDFIVDCTVLTETTKTLWPRSSWFALYASLMDPVDVECPFYP